MKLVEIEISNIRGIRNLLLRPEGENLVIWGPNGSGKSAVVDSIDFLLTGRISRLTGPTTGGISLARHGPHIEATQEEARVRAIVDIPGARRQVELRRCIATADSLECDPDVRHLLEPVLNLAERGQHVLTRREILKYIATQAGTRAQEIQHLLNLSDVESVRRALGTAERSARRTALEAREAVARAEARVATLLGLAAFDASLVGGEVNRLRGELSGRPIEAVRPSEVLVGLARPAETPIASPRLAEAAAALRTLRSTLSAERREERSRLAAVAHEQVVRLRGDPELHHAIRHRELLRLGADLLDEGGVCPLCEAMWDPSELRESVSTRLAAAETGALAAAEMDRGTSVLRTSVLTASTAVSQFLHTDELKIETDALREWQRRLELLLDATSDPLGRFTDEWPSPGELASLTSPANAGDLMDALERGLSELMPAPSREEEAWDQLTRIDEALVPVEHGRSRLDIAERASRRARLLSAAYESSRNRVLGSLYDSVKDRFVALYRQLHGADESGFEAELEPEGPGLELRVGFHGRGVYPPQALHSEGHQDTMGICLYLALAERLTTDRIQMTILDDVRVCPAFG